MVLVKSFKNVTEICLPTGRFDTIVVNIVKIPGRIESMLLGKSDKEIILRIEKEKQKQRKEKENNIMTEKLNLFWSNFGKCLTVPADKD